MAISKPKKPQTTLTATTTAASSSAEDLDRLKSEVASFASSLGLAPLSSAAAGFDDSDFRKPVPLKAPKTLAPDPGEPKKGDDRDLKPKQKPKPHPLQIDPFDHEDKKRLPTYPLMKASSLSGQWYADAEEVEARVLGQEVRTKASAAAMGIEVMKGLVARKKEVAERLMRQYAGEYEQSRRKSGDMKLLEVTARSGTSADKVSAFTCLVEDNPIANLRSLDALLSMVTSKVGKRYAFTGFEALKELFLSRLLPDRKLKCLFQRQLDVLPETKDGFTLLLFWYWEECLKQRYEKFVIALEEALKDMLPNLKDKAMKAVFILLKSKSEQERRLLTALVNKLGDPERKAASSAGYHLSCLLSAHPNMKAVVIDEVDSFLFRPHVGLRAKYQAVNFLSQILLSKKGDGPKIAKRLVDVYFALFKVLIAESHGNEVHKKSEDDKRNVKKKEKRGKVKAPTSFRNSKAEPSPESNVEMDSRLLSALLTGVNRAFPFVSSDEADDIMEVQTPVLFRLVHSENFNVGVQALMLLYQISSKNQIASDRFYRALYAKLLSPSAVSSSKPELFLGLLVKAMKNDINLKRVAAFSKRLLQVALQRPPQYACGCLFILSEVLKAKPPLWTMLLQNESVDDDLEHFEDIIESPEDLAVAPSGNSINSDELPTSLGGKKLADLVHDEEDHDLEVEVGCENVSEGNREENHTTNEGSTLPVGYNPRHREPSFCNADRASCWELTALASHVHPSVATMARTLLSGANIVYNGDPLNDLSLTAFLDKFMEKKPKVNRKAEGIWHGGSQIAPARKLDLSHHLIGDEILQLAEDEVPPEDVVFHRFYMNKTGSSKRLKAKKQKASLDDEDADLLLDGDDESAEEIDRMLGSGRSTVEEPEGEYDYDDLDHIAEEDDDDLLGDGSDAEAGPAPNQDRDKNDDDDDEDDIDDDDGGLALWDDVDEEHNNGGGGSDDDDEYGDADGSNKKKKTEGKKQKLGGRSRASPFASLEDYEHLMGGEQEKTNKLKKKTEKSKSQKKRKRSK
ncbi:CCAAT/enhancer-binding protein zeta isoform X2 [Ananas comosus]|uniref:CCAAT/enhancer-binding protein zeta isoform X2 n=1 Tax=Ananas comosus TaxID=4615 RepID=A0A6P5EXN4_ANACO|nr:CCAAT/enhancer-binding protein zeta isoform X2 [Ananas comosus]